VTSPSLDVVLVHPNGRAGIYQGLGDLAAVETPVWAGMLASYVRLKGQTVAILDAEAEGLSPAAVAMRVESLKPLLACVVVYGHQPSASTQVMTAARSTLKAIQEANPKIRRLLLGGHAAALPERSWWEEPVTYVCTGEGPVTLYELLSALKSGGMDLHRVRGLAWGDNGKVQRNPDAPLVQDLDAEIPAPAYDLLPGLGLYRAHNWHCFGGLDRSPYASLYTTLGCPYACSFCCIQAPFRSGEALAAQGKGRGLGVRPAANSYRFWSPHRVVETLVGLRDQGVTNVKIADEMFVLNPGHVAAICDQLIAADLHLNLWAYARVDTVRNGMARKLKAAGFNWLAFGIESAGASVRDGVHKSLDEAEIHETIAKVRAAGIHVIGNYIFGLPGDTVDTMGDTLQLARELQTEFANFYSAMAYPGSRLYEEAVAKGWELPSTWEGYSQHSATSLPLRTEHLSAARILQFRDQAFQSYHLDRAYLEMIERKFGPATVAEIRRMAGLRLERRVEA
jgi:anaerobic magnesium-protoporphyrin IX monomethyl ester cyclase